MTAPERPLSAIEALPSSERLLLESICVLGEADTYTLAQRSFISVTACRQHLRELDRAGLIASRQKKGDIGRPLTLYRLTELGRGLFPRGDIFSLLAVLDVLKSQSPAAYERMWTGLPRWFVLPDLEKARLQSNPFADRCEFALQFVRRFGHIVSREQTPEGDAEFVVHHCAVLQAARAHPGLCEAECAWWQNLFVDSEVVFTARQADGDPTCVFRVTAPSAN